VRALAAQLPAPLARWIYLECRLAANDRVDVTVAVTARDAELIDPAWHRLAAFARLWRRPVWRRRITRLWLEFDVPEPTPSLFAELADGADAPAWIDLAAARAVPAGATVRYVGLFPPRGTATIRLCVTDLADEAILSYLTSIRWPGSTAALRRELAALSAAHGASPGIIDVDVEPTGDIGPVLGLEYLFRRDTQTRGVLAELGLVDVLVARGMCTRERRDALVAFPRSRYATMPHELWESVLHHRVNHIKVTFARDEPLEAKAYLALGHEPRRRRSMQ
jgi:hypothetical protein